MQRCRHYAMHLDLKQNLRGLKASILGEDLGLIPEELKH